MVRNHEIVFPLEVLQVLFCHILDIEKMSVVICLKTFKRLTVKCTYFWNAWQKMIRSTDSFPSLLIGKCSHIHFSMISKFSTEPTFDHDVQKCPSSLLVFPLHGFHLRRS